MSTSLEEALGSRWTQLVEFAAEWGAPRGQPAAYALDDVGLNLELTGTRWTYDATPLNSLTFATTRVDGNHFGVLVRPNRPWPIVCTAPMAFDSPNVIVGESLDEFLDLGCMSGWFVLEQLAYDVTTAVETLAPDPDAWEEQALLLAAMRERLGLRPWTEIDGRLSELNARFLPEVTLPVPSPSDGSRGSRVFRRRSGPSQRLRPQPRWRGRGRP